MPSGRKHSPSKLAALMKNTSGTQAITRLREQCVTAATRQQYASRIRLLQGILDELQEPTLTLDIFAQFLEAYRQADNDGTSTAEGYRSAVLFHQTHYALWLDDSGKPWSSSQQCIEMCRGYKYRGKTPRQRQAPVRGTIDAAMYDQLLEYSKTHFPTLTTPIRIGYLVALRPHQLQLINGGCYDDQTRLLLVPDKTAHAKNQKPDWADKPVLDPDARTFLATLESVTPSGQPYFPELKQSSLRRCIKQAANHFGWTTDYPWLKFDGPHCLRHGGTLLNTTRLTQQEVPEAEQATLLRTSSRMLHHYRWTNQKRRREVKQRK